MTEEKQFARRMTVQINWRASPEDVALIKAILKQTGGSLTELMRQLVAEKAARLGLSDPPKEE